MKILQCHNQYVFPGGEDAVAQAEAKMLAASGHSIIQYHRSNQDIQTFSLMKKIQFYLKDIFFNQQVYRELRDLIQKEKPDIAHFHNSFFMLSPSAYQACLDENLPIVQTLHNYRFLCSAGILFRSGNICEKCLHQGRMQSVRYGCWHGRLQTLWMNRVIHQYKRNILSRISRFIALTDFERKKFISSGWSENKITIKHNFVKSVSKRNEIGDYVLFVGALQDYKGILWLLDTWQRYQISIPLKIVGSGPLEKELKNKQIPYVEILGQKTKPEVQSLMSRSLCLVVPSLCYETFSMVILESKASGVPIVTTSIGAMKEMVSDQQTGLLVKPYDQQGLYEAIQRLCDNQVFNQTLATNAYQDYQQKYTKAINAQQLINIYQDTIKNHATI